MQDFIFDGICLDPCGIGIVNRNILSKLIDTKKYNIYYNDSFDKYGTKKKIINQDHIKKITPLRYNYVSYNAPVIMSYALGFNYFSSKLITDYNHRYKIFHTVTEVDKLNSHCIEEMKMADEIWVPSNFDLNKFKQINDNTYTIIQGYDPLKYNRNIIPNKKVKDLCKDFVFLYSGSGLHRKGFKEIIRSYNQAFSIKDNVTLILMTTENNQEKFLNLIDIKELTNGAHIVLLDEYFHEDDIPAIYACADVFCLPSRGEGWSLPASEFAGMGKPSIITNYGGQLEFLDKNGSWLIDVNKFEYDPMMLKLNHTKQYENVLFPVLDKNFIDNFSYAMREAYDNKKLTIQKGNYIEDLVSKNFTWKNSCESVENRLLNIFKKIENDPKKNDPKKNDPKRNKRIYNFNKFSNFIINKKENINQHPIEIKNKDSVSYVIAMTTCNREEFSGKNLLETTINSIIKSGLFKSKIDYTLLLHDTGSEDVSYLEKFEDIPNVIVKKCKEKSHQVMNGYYMLKYIKENLPCDYVICIEDDILFCKNWLENIDGWIKKYKDDNDVFFTFYCPPYIEHEYLFKKCNEIWDKYPISAFYGAQCFSISFSEIENVTNTYKLEYDKKSGKEFIDIVLHKWLIEKYPNKYIKSSIPSFVQHINIGSSLHTNKHATTTFMGEDFDPKYFESDKIITKYVISILAYNRSDLGNDNLIKESMISLYKSGLFESNIDFKLLLHDSGSLDMEYLEEYKNLPNVIIKKCKQSTNQLVNAHSMLSYINNNIECDYIIYMEDDILFCKNWLENIDNWIHKHEENTDLIFSFYSPYLDTLIEYENNKDIDMWKYNIEKFYGAQCLAFKPDKILSILSIFNKSDLYPKNNGIGIPGFTDMLIQNWLKNNSEKSFIKCSVPNLIQHMNIASSYGTTGHKSLCFFGEDVDPRIKFKSNLICCIGTDVPNLVYNFIKYYKEMGVDNFLLIVHSKEQNSKNLEETLDILKSFNITPVYMWIEEFNIYKVDHKKWNIYDTCKSSDWILDVDLDEFIELPDEFSNINDFLYYCDVNNYTYVDGEFIDRVSKIGELNKINRTEDIFNQFPIKCRITRDILKEPCAKTPIMKGNLRPTHGHHSIDMDVSSNKIYNKCPFFMPVNHFKWDFTVIDRLEKFANDNDLKFVNTYYRDASKKFIDYINLNKKIDINNLELI